MNPMRRSDRALDAAESLLARGEYGILSTVDSTCQPYGTPLNYVVLDDAVYFHCAVEGTKLNNIIANPKVCFTVVVNTKILPDKFSTAFESVMAFGQASIVTDEKKLAVLKALIDKYSPDYQEAGAAYIEKYRANTTVVKITIDHLTGKRRIS